MKKLLAISIILTAILSLQAQQDITKIDKNFAVEKVDKLEVVYFDALEKPFELEGFPWYEKGKPLRRIPHNVGAKETNNGVNTLANHTAGGVIRFRTDSPYITIKAKLLNENQLFGHMPSTGISGFDMFCGTYSKNVNPLQKGKLMSPVEAVVIKEGTSGTGMRDCTLYMPLYNGVEWIKIGVAPNSKIEAPKPHKIKKPILFYGSSITQGGCASRPANVYTAMLCRELDAPMINLGFSGSAKGEEKMAELIASLDISVFVYDYDHNAPTLKHLKETHEKFFKYIRAKRPDLPIIMMSRITRPEWAKDRASVIKQTYDNARKNGDNLVWFIDGHIFTKDIDQAYWTMDNTHPNDFGFYLMYKHTLPVLKEALKKSK